MLAVLRSSEVVDIEEFKEYTLKTAELFVDLYGSWCYMPSTVHEVLLHGWRVLEYLPLPHGLLSEEALESRNRNIRSYRLVHSRKISEQV